MNDPEIEKEVTKSIAQEVNELLQNIVGKNAVLFLKVFANLSFIPQQSVPEGPFGKCGNFHISKKSWERIQEDLSKHTNCALHAIWEIILS